MSIIESLDELQATIGEGNAAKGFRVDLGVLDPAALRNYQITKLALIITEAAEGIEELRKGRYVDETYYIGDSNKPEGVPSEVADILIRCLDFADEFDFALSEITMEKLNYNATREPLHGKKV